MDAMLFVNLVIGIGLLDAAWRSHRNARPRTAALLATIAGTGIALSLFVLATGAGVPPPGVD
jgi:hypothetical protein